MRVIFEIEKKNKKHSTLSTRCPSINRCDLWFLFCAQKWVRECMCAWKLRYSLYHSYLPSIVIAVVIEIWSRTHLRTISYNFRSGNEMEKLWTGAHLMGSWCGRIAEIVLCDNSEQSREMSCGLPEVPVWGASSGERNDSRNCKLPLTRDLLLHSSRRYKERDEIYWSGV
mgnify:CR=1 FL=1